MGWIASYNARKLLCIGVRVCLVFNTPMYLLCRWLVDTPEFYEFLRKLIDREGTETWGTKKLSRRSEAREKKLYRARYKLCLSFSENWNCRLLMAADHDFYIPFTIPIWGVAGTHTPHIPHTPHTEEKKEESKKGELECYNNTFLACIRSCLLFLMLFSFSCFCFCFPEDDHVHLNNHFNFVFHADHGKIIGVSAYPGGRLLYFFLS